MMKSQSPANDLALNKGEREAEQTAVPTAYGEAADLNQDGTTTRSETRAYKRAREDATNDETSGDCDMYALFLYRISFLFCIWSKRP